MIEIFTNLIPLALGFFAKLTAIKSQQASDNQKLMIESLTAKRGAIKEAREAAQNESPMAAMNRRIIVLTILALIVVYVAAPLFFDITTAVPIVEEGFSILGFNVTGDTIRYEQIKGLVRYDEIFDWAAMLIEFYFGAQMAKGK